MENTPEETKVKHHWLYTFLPKRLPGTEYDLFYLLGYCPACGKGFTQRMKVQDTYDITVDTLDVPEWGCRLP